MPGEENPGGDENVNPRTNGRGSAASMMSSEENKRSVQLFFLARIAIAAALLGLVFFFVPFDQLLGALSSMSVPALSAAVVAGLLAQVSVASRLRQLLRPQGLDFTLAHVLAVNLSTTFYGLFLPGGNLAGILVRLYRFSGQQANYSGAVVMLVFDRLVATGSMCAVGALAWLVERPEAGWSVLALMLFGLLITVAGPLALSAGILPMERLERLSGSKLKDWITRLVVALRLARSLPRSALIRVLILALVAHFLGTLVYWLVAVAADIEVSITTMFWVRSAALLLAVLPVSISGLGVREGAFVVFLSAYGVSGADGFAISLTGFACTTVLAALLGGAVEAWQMTRSRPDR